MSNSDTKRYKSYFSRHYGYDFSEENLSTYHSWFNPQWQFIKSFIDPSEITKQHILEVGSSIGSFSQFLAQDGADKVTGIELDAQAASFAQKRFPAFRYENTSLEAFKSNKKYDLIFAFEVLEHVDNPKLAIAKIHTLLKPGGKFIGSSPFPYPKNIFADTTHQNVLHPQNWQKLFNDVGFYHVSTHPMSFIPLLWRYTSLFHRRIPFYIPWKFWISTTLIVAKK